MCKQKFCSKFLNCRASSLPVCAGEKFRIVGYDSFTTHKFECIVHLSTTRDQQQKKKPGENLLSLHTDGRCAVPECASNWLIVISKREKDDEFHEAATNERGYGINFWTINANIQWNQAYSGEKRVCLRCLSSFATCQPTSQISTAMFEVDDIDKSIAWRLAGGVSKGELFKF